MDAVSAPDGTISHPAAFIPVAEDRRLIVALGVRMLEMAAEEASGWRDSTEPAQALGVAVNLSARQFESGHLNAIVAGTLERYLYARPMPAEELDAGVRQR